MRRSKVVEVTVAGLSERLNVAVTCTLLETPVAPLDGEVDVTAGAGRAVATVNVQV